MQRYGCSTVSAASTGVEKSAHYHHQRLAFKSTVDDQHEGVALRTPGSHDRCRYGQLQVGQVSDVREAGAPADHERPDQRHRPQARQVHQEAQAVLQSQPEQLEQTLCGCTGVQGLTRQLGSGCGVNSFLRSRHDEVTDIHSRSGRSHDAERAARTYHWS